MTSVRELVFFDPVEVVEAPSGCMAQLESKPEPERATPVDVVVQVSDTQTVLSKFAGQQSTEVGGQRQREVLPVVYLGVFEHGRSFVLVGELAVVVIDFVGGACRALILCRFQETRFCPAMIAFPPCLRRHFPGLLRQCQTQK